MQQHKNKTNKVVIFNDNNDNVVSMLVHPQLIRNFKYRAIDSSGNEVFSIDTLLDFELRKGSMNTITIQVP